MSELSEIFESFSCKICFLQYSKARQPYIICKNFHLACLICTNKFRKSKMDFDCPFCRTVNQSENCIPFDKLFQIKKATAAIHKRQDLFKKEIQQLRSKKSTKHVGQVINEKKESKCSDEDINLANPLDIDLAESKYVSLSHQPNENAKLQKRIYQIQLSQALMIRENKLLNERNKILNDQMRIMKQRIQFFSKLVLQDEEDIVIQKRTNKNVYAQEIFETIQKGIDDLILLKARQDKLEQANIQLNRKAFQFQLKCQNLSQQVRNLQKQVSKFTKTDLEKQRKDKQEENKQRRRKQSSSVQQKIFEEILNDEHQPAHNLARCCGSVRQNSASLKSAKHLPSLKNAK